MKIRVFGSTTVLVVMMYRFGFINFICGIPFGFRPNVSIQTDKIVCILCGTINCTRFRLVLLLLVFGLMRRTSTAIRIFVVCVLRWWRYLLIHLHRKNRHAALALYWIIKRQPANGQRSLNCCVALDRRAAHFGCMGAITCIFLFSRSSFFGLTRSNLFFWCYFVSLSYFVMLFSWVFVFLSLLFSRYFCITPHFSLSV